MRTQAHSNTITLVGISTIIVLVLLAGGIYFLGLSSDTQSVIPASCSLQNTGSKFGSYQCPESASFCDVDVTLDCLQPTFEPNVVLRVSEQSSFPNQLAVDSDGDGDLEPWRKTTSSASQALCSQKTRIENGFFNSFIILHNGDVHVCTGTDIIRYIQISASIPIQNSPLEPYASTTREKYAGTQNIYQCSQKIAGDKTYTVSYSDDEPGSQRKSITLAGGDAILWDGLISYSESINKQSQCTLSIPGNSPDTYFACILDVNSCGILSTTETFCEEGLIFKESEQACGVPYTLDVTVDKQIFGVSDPITGDVALSNTDQKAFIEISLTLEDVLGKGKSFQTVSTNSRGKASFSLSPQPLVGDYKLVVSADHPDGSLPQEKFISIAQPISVRLAGDNIQFNSNAIVVSAFVTDNQGNPKQASSWDLSGSVCGTKDLSQDIQIRRIGSSSQGTEYQLLIPIQTTCNLVFKVVAIDNTGFRSNADAITVDVREK